MELVEGETLADRIARGPIPLDEALPIAKQVAEALEAAHDQGIIHRDLVPTLDRDAPRIPSHRRTRAVNHTAGYVDTAEVVIANPAPREMAEGSRRLCE
jgi:hypothetical protein